MAEGLADAARIHRLAKLEASAGPKAQPAFTRVLLVLVTHSPLRTRSLLRMEPPKHPAALRI